MSFTSSSAWVIALVAVSSLALRCGGEGADDGGGTSHPRAGEGGNERGGSSSDGGADTDGGRSGTSGSGGTSDGGGSPEGGGTQERGGSAGRGSGGVSGMGTSGTGGEGDAGGSDAGHGGVEVGGAAAGGEGGSGGGSAGESGCHDPPATTLCTDSLDGIGTADFEVKFTLFAYGQEPDYAIIGQREHCGHSYFWSARLIEGRLYFELDDDNLSYVACWSPVSLNDALVHRVVVRRMSGVLSIVVDCGAPTTCAAPTDLSMPMGELRNRTNDVCIGYGVAPLAGWVADRCVRPL